MFANVTRNRLPNLDYKLSKLKSKSDKLRAFNCIYASSSVMSKVVGQNEKHNAYRVLSNKPRTQTAAAHEAYSSTARNQFQRLLFKSHGECHLSDLYIKRWTLIK